MGIIRGSQIFRANIGTAPATLLLEANPKRAGLYIEVVGGTGNVAVGFGTPNVAVTGDNRGLVLAQNAIYTESPPNVNTGRIYIISANADEDILYREDTFDD